MRVFEKKKINLMSKKQKKKEKRGDNCLGRADQILFENEETQKTEQTDAGPRKKKNKLMSKKQKEKRGDNCLGRADQILSEYEETQKTKQTDGGPRKKKNKLMSKKQRKKERSGDNSIGAADQIACENEGTQSNLISDGSVDEIIKHKKRIQAENQSRMVNDEEPLVRKNGMNKSNKVQKAKHKNHSKPQKEKNNELEKDEVYEISSGDEDCSKGMKKWLTEYHQNRPGLKVLQERIDEFIMAHEAQEEKARKEREALAAEGGWTVVAHHKGRKKTTDAESGITVGSVSQLAAVDKMEKKKNKVALDFYNFQRREAQRHEVMMLQNKFEQDKKRIQQLRAARRFKPY